MKPISLIVVVGMVLMYRDGLSEEAKNFFVAPIVTQLQRETISSTAGTYAVVNCNHLVGTDGVDLSRFDQDGFIAALTEAAPAKKQLLLVHRFEGLAIKEQTQQQIKSDLSKIAESAGFERVTNSVVVTTQKWTDIYSNAMQFNEPAAATEPLIEDELVRVASVRTKLSKFVHGDVDCIVEIVQPIDGRFNDITPTLKSAISKAVQAAQPAQKQTLLFRLSSTSAGRNKVEVLFNARMPPQQPDSEDSFLMDLYRKQLAAYKPSPGFELANQLGFKQMRYSHTPNGGAPERLLDKRVPNFQLKRLDGGEFDLHAAIKDRPALVTFWGLACGPCRKEAPYLTAFHQKYSDAFAIVAVNAYNDDREAVAKYASDEKLTHPMVLQGESVANDLYFVGAYPTTFWIDRTGNVLHYEVGFQSGEAIERQIQKMLGTGRQR